MVSMQPSTRRKIIFVEPRGVHANVFAKFMTMPMLGPLILGTIAEEAGYEVLILNENILGRDILPEELMHADILCVSCMTATIQRGKAIAREYKDLRIQQGHPARTLVGGIHASMIPEDVVEHFDQVFVGEAETKILDVLAGRITDKVVHGEPLADMDSTPLPNFELLKDHHKVRGRPIMTSRGCPYDCTFCSVSEMFGRGYRTKSVDRVMEEVRACQGRNIFFVDDHFVVNKKRTQTIIQRIKSLEHGTVWSCQLRTEISRDSDLVAQMRDAGCSMVYIGFESINPEALKLMNKGQSVDDIRRSIRVFKQTGIGVHGMFMFGTDADRLEAFQSTAEFCRDSGLTTAQYMALTPLPGTRFYKQIEAEGRLLHKNWGFYDTMHVVFRPKHMTPIQLQEGLISCFSHFYCYLSAFNEAISTVFNTLGTLFKRFYKTAYFPTHWGIFFKFFGRRLLRSWVDHNKEYLQYLRGLT